MNSKDPNYRQRLVSDALDKMAFVKTQKDQQRRVDSTLARFDGCITRVLGHAKEIAKAGGAVKPDDQKALRTTVFTMLLQELDWANKEELTMLLVPLLADRLMDEIEASPWGGETPDQLSGK